MKYLLVMISSVFMLVVGVYIGELRMQVETLEHVPAQKSTTILNTTHTTVLDKKLIGLLK